jgi:hypothetical protein
MKKYTQFRQYYPKLLHHQWSRTEEWKINRNYMYNECVWTTQTANYIKVSETYSALASRSLLKSIFWSQSSMSAGTCKQENAKLRGNGIKDTKKSLLQLKINLIALNSQ